MNEEDIRWTEEYAVGVEIIDQAHQDLFRTARRLVLLSKDKKKHRWVAQEGLKFLKAYVVRHFAEEEEYMQSINYPYKEGHFEQHVALREKILPRMESRLREENFSEAAVGHFLYIVQLWLCRHILIHDTAIGKFNQAGEENGMAVEAF